MEEGCDCSHASAPEADGVDSSVLSEVVNYLLDIIPFVPAQWNIFPFTHAAACEVKAEEGHVGWEDKLEEV